VKNVVQKNAKIVMDAILVVLASANLDTKKRKKNLSEVENFFI